MGDVIDLESRAKRVRPPIVLGEDQLVAAVEQRLHGERSRGGWRLNKRMPRDQQDLIILARNLAFMRERLPHGKKSEVLRAAGFEGGANPSTYVNNLCLPSTMGTPSTDRLRRLSSTVEKYVSVAIAIEGDRRRALARLFRGTSLDRTSDDWQGKLSLHLDHLAQRVTTATDLAQYFDQASSFNVCATESDVLGFRLTSWLSETFHKIDFAEAHSQNPKGAWLYDRSEEGTPKKGAPLFVPTVTLDNSDRVWAVCSTRGDGKAISCVFSSALSLAIVPIAGTLDEPCRVECWLFERPTVTLKSARKDVWQVRVDQSVVSILSGEDIYQPIDNAGFLSWSTSEEGRLFVEHADGTIVQSDLLCGGWWCAATSPEIVLGRLSRPRFQGRAIAMPHGRRVEGIVSDLSEMDEVDYHSAAPEAYPPQGSLALELAYGLTVLEDALKRSADQLVAKFRTFKREVALASPLSE